MRYYLLIVMTVFVWSNDDLALLNLAYKNGIKPVPNTLESLVQVLNTNAKELSKEKIILGKKLFFEKALSLDHDISCATCHGFDKGGADSMSTAIGHQHQKNPFHLNTPTVFNAAFSKKFFWNGRSDTLQEQAKGPLQAPFEMSITPELAEDRIKDNKIYVKLFQKVYGKNSITFENIANSIAAYEKTIVTRGRFDDFLLGDFDSLNKQEKEGLKLFIAKSCVGCHNGIGLGGQVLRKFPLVYHNIWSLVKPSEVKNIQKRYRDFLTDLKDQGFKDNKERVNYISSKMNRDDMRLIKDGFFDIKLENGLLKT